MRAVVLLLVLAGCGDNAPICGHVTLLDAYRNIWPGHIAVDGERVYYSDYGNLAGTHLVFRQPRDGGQPLVIAARGISERFGYGMATDGAWLYWAAESQMIGYTLFATPVLGGSSLPLASVSPCTASGVAVDAIAAYAGAHRCGEPGSEVAARVIAVPHDGSAPTTLWTSDDADVSSIAAIDGTVYIATTAGLIRVLWSDTAVDTELLDGRPIYHVVIAGDDVVYATQEEIIALPMPGGGAPRKLYTFRTPVNQPRAFAVDGNDLYIAEPPELVFVARGGAPTRLVRDIGTVVTHIVARDGAAYWSTLVLPGTVGGIGTFTGGVRRVDRPCE